MVLSESAKGVMQNMQMDAFASLACTLCICIVCNAKYAKSTCIRKMPKKVDFDSENHPSCVMSCILSRCPVATKIGHFGAFWCDFDWDLRYNTSLVIFKGFNQSKKTADVSYRNNENGAPIRVVICSLFVIQVVVSLHLESEIEERGC